MFTILVQTKCVSKGGNKKEEKNSSECRKKTELRHIKCKVDHLKRERGFESFMEYDYGFTDLKPNHSKWLVTKLKAFLHSWGCKSNNETFLILLHWFDSIDLSTIYSFFDATTSKSLCFVCRIFSLKCSRP